MRLSISTYLIVAGILGGLGYYAYLTFVPQPKKRKTPTVSAPVSNVTATGAGGYQEEWIPEHHLKKPKAKKTISPILKKTRSLDRWLLCEEVR